MPNVTVNITTGKIDKPAGATAGQWFFILHPAVGSDIEALNDAPSHRFTNVPAGTYTAYGQRRSTANQPLGSQASAVVVVPESVEGAEQIDVAVALTFALD